MAAIFAGGLAPLIATALLAWSGTYWPISAYLALFGILSTIAVIKAPETKGVDSLAGMPPTDSDSHSMNGVGEPV